MGLQQTLQVEFFTLAVEKTIIPFEIVAIAARRLGIRAAGSGGLIADNLHQAPRAPGIAQFTVAKFLFRPSPRLQATGRVQGVDGHGFDAHPLAHVLHQRALSGVRGARESARPGRTPDRILGPSPQLVVSLRHGWEAAQ